MQVFFDSEFMEKNIKVFTRDFFNKCRTRFGLSPRPAPLFYFFVCAPLFFILEFIFCAVFLGCTVQKRGWLSFSLGLVIECIVFFALLCVFIFNSVYSICYGVFILCGVLCLFWFDSFLCDLLYLFDLLYLYNVFILYLYSASIFFDVFIFAFFHIFFDFYFLTFFIFCFFVVLCCLFLLVLDWFCWLFNFLLIFSGFFIFFMYNDIVKMKLHKKLLECLKYNNVKYSIKIWICQFLADIPYKQPAKKTNKKALQFLLPFKYKLVVYMGFNPIFILYNYKQGKTTI